MKTRTHSKYTIDAGSIVLAIVLIVFLLLSVAGFVYMDRQTSFDKEYLKLAGEQRVLSQNIVTNAMESTNANASAFALLAQARNQFAQNLSLLRLGNPETRLPPATESLMGPLNSVTELWSTFGNHAQTILNSEATIRNVSEIIQIIYSTMSDLLSLSDEVVSIMVESSASSKQIYVASRQLMLIPRLSINANKILLEGLQQGESSTDAAKNLQKDAIHFGRILDAMQNGNRAMGISKVSDPNARKKLTEVSKLYNSVNDMITRVLAQAPDLTKAQTAAQAIITNGPALLERSTTLMEAYTALPDKRLITGAIAYVLGGITLCIFTLLSIRIQRGTKKSLVKKEAQNQRNQEAIGRLLDEISNLANGDLTIHATVTDDITGAIAEAINYTIDQLRRLVSTINETTEQVSNAALATQATAMHLAEASDQQAEQLIAVTGAIKQMSVSIDTVSINADRSSEVATTSVEIAKKGAITVQNSIRGMDTIREQIQATSKRIKRLGESSQEIGDMVEIINDIADQTNILALNAAIQASMAGKSGHGFAIVADEVQGLAEKSTDATRQIETLVNTILADTHEAVVSMEQSTAQVVAGTKITQNAGEALTEIQNVSNLLADLTQSISASAQQQASAASSISASMNVIQKVTTENLTGTNKTSASVGYLAELSNELRKSVAGFKLPEQPQ